MSWKKYLTGKTSSILNTSDDHMNYIADGLNTFGDEGAYSPTGTVGETIHRRDASLTDVAAALTTQVLLMVGLPIQQGQLITNVNFAVGATSASAPTNWWATLSLASDRKVLAVTADQLTAAITGNAAGAKITVPFATPYTTLVSGLYYVGLMVKATTVPSLISQTNVAASVIVNAQPPIVVGTSDTAQTTPPAVGATHGALTAVANIPYVWLT